MYSIFKKTLVTVALIIGCLKANSQFVASGLEIGINAGTLIYQGDLSTSFFGYTRSLSPAVGLHVSKPIDSYFSIRANIVRGRIGADESTYSNPVWRKFRGFAFSTPLTEFSGVLNWDPFGRNNGDDYRRLSPYFFAGAGITLLNVHRDWSKYEVSYFGEKSASTVGLARDTLYKTPGVVVVFPIGAGLRYALSDHLYLNAEATYRVTSSDFIDGFRYAANPKRNDYYYSLSAGISYRFGHNELACPRVNF